MLNPHYTYCFLDFETTGLSYERDDIIQVGLIITNSQLQILNHYSSFINPGYEIEQLKTIVSYTTGISIDQITSGISLDEFVSKMQELIPQDAIFIGQNIQFDLTFLHKYVATQATSSSNVMKYEAGSIDTLDWAKALIHYPSSYSLDVLYPIVREQLGSDYFISLASSVGLQDIQNHDALSDCLICIGLMHYFLQRIQSIVSSFPSSIKVIEKSSMRFLDQAWIENIPKHPLADKVPLLDFPSKPELSIIHDDSIDWQTIPNASKLYYGDLPIEQLVRKASSLGKYIICTNSRHKLNIIKSKCKAMGLHGISFIKEQQQVDRDKLNNVYMKPVLEQREGRFFLKYCSHKLQGLGLLDLNTPGDYKIYNYIREDIQTSKSNIILATHSALYASLEQGEYSDYTILFLDYEWRYNSYLKYAVTPWDPVNFARVLDNFIYEYRNDKAGELLESATGIVSLIDIFCGALFMEVRDYIQELRQNSQGKYEIGVISGNKLFPKTNGLYEKINHLMKDEGGVMSSFPDEDWKVITKQFEKLQHYIESIVVAMSVVSDYTNYTFTVGNNFVEYSEFCELFKGYRYYFLSNTNTTFKKLPVTSYQLPVDESKSKLKVFEVSSIDAISKIALEDKVFILNNNPTKAKKLFEYLMKDEGRGEGEVKHKVLVENVTGGRGKNIALVKTHAKRIMVGGYEMLLQCLQEKITPTQVIVYEQQGLLHQQIIGDLQYRFR